MYLLFKQLSRFLSILLDLKVIQNQASIYDVVVNFFQLTTTMRLLDEFWVTITHLARTQETGFLITLTIIRYEFYVSIVFENRIIWLSIYNR